MLFINVTCGIAILAVASPMGVEIAGLFRMCSSIYGRDAGVFNGAGRLIWASISDYIGRTNLYTLFFILQIGIFAVLPFTTKCIAVPITAVRYDFMLRRRILCNSSVHWRHLWNEAAWCYSWLYFNSMGSSRACRSVHCCENL